MNHNERHKSLPPHLEPMVKGRDGNAKNLYIVMRRLLRKNRWRIWQETTGLLKSAILYGMGYGKGFWGDM